ncbi:MAG: hypothetical protein WC329_00795 [Candidatus Omnitrophota bacterium]|jgi:hypothetical protein|nr:hypothetical protein [Candidatus Omnitrophota bacterium]
MRIFGLTVSFIALFFSPARCEKLYLKDGRAVKGVVIEENGKYVEIVDAVYGCPMLYFSGEIDRITNDSGRPRKDRLPEKNLQAPVYPLYRNADFRFEIPVPDGWGISAFELTHSHTGKKPLMEVTFLPEKGKKIPYFRIQVFDTESPRDLLLSVKDRMRKYLFVWKKKGGSAFQVKEWPCIRSSRGQEYISREMLFIAQGKSGCKEKPGTQTVFVDSFFPGQKYMVKVSMYYYLNESSRYKSVYEELTGGFRFTK